MTETNEKITTVKNSEDLKKLEIQYKAQIEELEQKTLDWENAAITARREKSEIEKIYKVKLKEMEQNRNEWKNEALINRKIHQEQRQDQERSDFQTEFIKLQQKKGIVL